MVLEGEGRGKVSSTHLIEYFGDQKPPKIGRYDLNRIIISLSIHIHAFRLEKLQKPTYMRKSTSGAHFGELGSESLYGQFKPLNVVFQGLDFSLNGVTPYLYLQFNSFQTLQFIVFFHQIYCEKNSSGISMAFYESKYIKMA